MKDELGGERTRDLSLKVFEVSSGEIGAAMAQVRTARKGKRSFILLVLLDLKGSDDSGWELCVSAEMRDGAESMTGDLETYLWLHTCRLRYSKKPRKDFFIRE